MKDEIAARRSFVRMLSMGFAAMGAGRMRAGQAAATATAPPLVPLTSADPAAKALGYTDDSNKVDAAANPTHMPDQKCSTCVQFQGKPGEARAACNIYPGKSVSQNGWCKVWAKKP